MNRYFLEFSFKGTGYHGWQLQPNARTVQQVMEDSLKMISGAHIPTTGAGRTDTGVHARHFTAHFESDHTVFESGDLFVRKMNSILPKDIAIKKLYKVKEEAHARFSALSRTYEYVIRKVRDPFDTEFSWYFARPLDLKAMNMAAAKLTEYTDFTSFSKLHSNTRTNLCHVTLAEWKEEDGTLKFRVKADRFLRNMVRAMVGTLIEVGLGNINLAQFMAILDARDRNKAGFSVPAHGLSLMDIEYPDEIRS
jgi:tRNA pseudouridine38-40 synthase